MLFLCLYTPAAPPSAPSPEHMAKMGEYAKRSKDAGKLVSTGPLGRREAGGARVRLAAGKTSIEPGAKLDSSLMRASGYAFIRAATREAATDQVTEFMSIAGDGEVELLAVPEMPGPQ
jgi:hypothetical protein